MPLITRARRIATRALDNLEARLDASDEPREDSGAAVYNAITLSGLGGQDKGASSQVNTTRRLLEDRELGALYRISGISKRIVDLVPDYATRRPVTVTDNNGNVVLDEELNAIGMLDAIREAWTWGRLYGGGFILLVTDDPEDQLFEPLKQPAVITSLAVLDGTEAQPSTYQLDATKPRYRDPETYTLTPNGPGGGTVSGVVVHWTRLVYIPGALVPPSLRYQGKSHDDSILEAMFTSIAGKEGMDSARDAMLQERKLSILKVSGLDAKTSGRDGSAFLERMKILAMGRSNLSTILLRSDEDYQVHDSSFSGWKELDESARTQIAAVAGYPSVIVWGTSPNGMSSDDQSARRQWAGIVSSESNRRMVPAIKHIALAMLPEGSSVTVEVPRIDDPSDAEAAETTLKLAQADATNIQNSVLSPDEVRQGRFGTGNGSITIEEDTLIDTDPPPSGPLLKE